MFLRTKLHFRNFLALKGTSYCTERIQSAGIVIFYQIEWTYVKMDIRTNEFYLVKRFLLDQRVVACAFIITAMMRLTPSFTKWTEIFGWIPTEIKAWFETLTMTQMIIFIMDMTLIMVFQIVTMHRRLEKLHLRISKTTASSC